MKYRQVKRQVFTHCHLVNNVEYKLGVTVGNVDWDAMKQVRTMRNRLYVIFYNKICGPLSSRK